MTDTLLVPFADIEFPVSDLDNLAWQNAERVRCHKYWSGEPAPSQRHFEARLLWSNTSLYVRFEANQGEPLVVSEDPVLGEKTLGLWDRDVCEIFMTPGVQELKQYFEFEVAPTGEWVDLAITFDSGGRKTDAGFMSGFEAAAEVRGHKTVSAMKIPWSSIGGPPSDGEARMGNLYRCVGKDPDRGYLAWLPTFAEFPNFHVPERFGKFRFVR